MRSFQCSVWKHFIIRSEKSIWDENNHPGHQITVITLSAWAPELSVSGCSSSQRLCWYFHLYGHFVSDNSSYSSKLGMFKIWHLKMFLIVIMSLWWLRWSGCDAEGMYLYLWGAGAPSSDYVFMWPPSNQSHRHRCHQPGQTSADKCPSKPIMTL